MKRTFYWPLLLAISPIIAFASVSCSDATGSKNIESEFSNEESGSENPDKNINNENDLLSNEKLNSVVADDGSKSSQDSDNKPQMQKTPENKINNSKSKITENSEKMS
ncbi:Uncharacterised protein [Mycoplasmopsis citelli]|uniref:Lipoprotein n=1 Tax=Mycoplasmopsis citelli TaxID=171281 RepID=A0A449B1G2_9BACT|nr:hypothetical protein [Mycoplasmopsis citelli]VEU74406.1 Uncharacterised protein [Mycoplasmopsis citelli]